LADGSDAACFIAAKCAAAAMACGFPDAAAAAIGSGSSTARGWEPSTPEPSSPVGATAAEAAAAALKSEGWIVFLETGM
jgi:hypothetical protein